MKTSEQKFIRRPFPLVILMFTRTVPGFDPDKNPYALAEDAGESPKPRLTRSSRKLLKIALSKKLCPKNLCLNGEKTHDKHHWITIGSSKKRRYLHLHCHHHLHPRNDEDPGSHGRVAERHAIR